jgi:hypothetical protein
MLQLMPTSFWRPLRGGPAAPILDGQAFDIADTIPAMDRPDPVLDRLLWKPQSFQAVCAHDSTAGDLTVRFPSPLPQGRPLWDRVLLDWHVARQGEQFVSGPAVLVIDILQGGHLVANYIAKTMAKHGIHGFVLHMPQNGRRKAADQGHDWSLFLPALRQAVGDARRARDVIAALPLVRRGVGIQGTSLGGFIATLAAAIDNAFDPVLLALTGGDIYRILSVGKRDAARVRRHLRDAGFDDAKLRQWLWRIEPLRVAHRLDPKRTWLFSARFDQVVPRNNARQLAAAIGLSFNHRRELAGCHYSCVLSARRFLSEMVAAIGWRCGLHAPTA